MAAQQQRQQSDRAREGVRDRDRETAPHHSSSLGLQSTSLLTLAPALTPNRLPQPASLQRCEICCCCCCFFFFYCLCICLRLLLVFFFSTGYHGTFRNYVIRAETATEAATAGYTEKKENSNAWTANKLYIKNNY